MARFAARLHVLLAKDAPIGLVIRRGPSKHVATILWDRSTDHFQLGQWFKGRIYERRCDLSPDGKYFLYFAMNGKWNSESRGSWSAIARTPFLKAVAMMPKGDCWFGGGLWIANRKYWLNDADAGHRVLQDTSVASRDRKWKPTDSFGGECPGVYYPRLLRDGWRLTDSVQSSKWKTHVIFEKQFHHGWTLRKLAHAELGAPPGKGCYWDEHELIHVASGQSIACPGWEWADREGDRLVWACRGRIETGRPTNQGIKSVKLLYDFNDMAFTAVPAPY